MDVYSHLLPLQSAFPTLIKLVRITLTVAVSTAQCERSFSALKRIKTYLRTTMGEQRLSDIAILSIERDLSNKISFNDEWNDSKAAIITGLSSFTNFSSRDFLLHLFVVIVDLSCFVTLLLFCFKI